MNAFTPFSLMIPAPLINKGVAEPLICAFICTLSSSPHSQCSAEVFLAPELKSDALWSCWVEADIWRASPREGWGVINDLVSAVYLHNACFVPSSF